MGTESRFAAELQTAKETTGIAASNLKDNQSADLATQLDHVTTGVNISEKAARYGLETAVNGTAAQMAQAIAGIQEMGLKASDAPHHDPMKLSAPPTPNAPAKGGQELAHA